MIALLGRTIRCTAHEMLVAPLATWVLEEVDSP